MKKQALATVVVTLGLSFSALAGNNPRIDQALMDNLAEKQALKVELTKSEPSDSQLNSRYRGLEVIEVGDELGGFTSSTGLANESKETLE